MDSIVMIKGLFHNNDKLGDQVVSFSTYVEAVNFAKEVNDTAKKNNITLSAEAYIVINRNACSQLINSLIRRKNS